MLGALLLPATASAYRSFAPRFSTNDTGAIVLAANTVLTCPAAAAGCTAAQGNSSAINNSFAMEHVDVDSDPTTFGSSTATLSLPGGATVLFAGLYWGAFSPSADRGTALLQVPGAVGYTTVTASTLDTGTGGNVPEYQAFADVTSIVQASGAGDYTVANVQANTGGGAWGGWTLVVAYRDPSEPVRSLTVFDGFLQASGTGLDIPVSGFLTPPTGPVVTDLGFVAYEGDAGGGFAVDGGTLNGVTLSDAAHPATNLLDSRISRDGVHVTTKNPNYVNQLGYDSFTMLAPTGSLGNSQTSATIRLTTVADGYLLGVVTFATELYAPDIDASKSLTDVNGGSVEPGDTLEYTIALTNNGNDAATDVVVTDAIPAGTTYAPGSLEIGGVAKTDVAGDDEAEFDAGAGEAVWRVGTGASASSGGTLAVGASATVSFSVIVDADVAGGTEIVNVAEVSSVAQTLGTSFTTEADVATDTAAPISADLALSKDVAPASAEPGEMVTYSLVVTNNGPSSALDVVVEDLLPQELTFVSASGGCSAMGQTVTCTADVLPAGASRTFQVRALVGETTGSFENTAVVSSSTPADAVPGNDRAMATLSVSTGGAPPAEEPGALAPTCDALVRPCAAPPPEEEPPAWWPQPSEDDGPATGQPRMPDLRGHVSASWDGGALHIVLRVRIVKPKLVPGSVPVSLSIAGVLDRTVRISPRRRSVVVRSLDIRASTLTGNPSAARLVVRIDPGHRIAEYRERNNTLRTRVR